MSFAALLTFLVSLLLSLLGGALPFPAIKSGSTPTATTSAQRALVENATTTPSTVTSVLPLTDKILPPIQKPAMVTPTQPKNQTAPKQVVTIADLHSKASSALVNIFCTTKRDGQLKPITASGIIISPEGVVLTNAHVAQYYLLKNYRERDFIDCIIRTGSPASPQYKASLLYISPLWIAENKSMINAEKQMGTGENDFALLLITEKINGSPLPSQFPYVSLISEDNDIMDNPKANYLLAGYPAGFLGGSAIVNDLYQISTTGLVEKVYTFRDDTADVLSFGGSLLAQRGASGGVALSEINGKVAGLIVTTTEAKNTEDRDLHLITGSHVNRSFLADTGKTLPSFLNSNLFEELEEFSIKVAPDLTAQLVKELQK